MYLGDPAPQLAAQALRSGLLRQLADRSCAALGQVPLAPPYTSLSHSAGA